MSQIHLAIDSQTKSNVQKWLDSEIDEESKKEIRELMQNDPEELVNAFYTNLSFGTGGLRGLSGIGTNRMNKYTVRLATQGLANYLNHQDFSASKISVIIGYDSRTTSRMFAEEAAKVLAGNGIHVYLYEELRPVPMVSFGCRYKKCQAGIMITASHNPPDYNGYKVYWSDGCQVLPPHDTGIIDEVDKIIEIDHVRLASLDDPHIAFIGGEIDEAYLNRIAELQQYKDQNQENGDQLHIVYSPLHGTGITMVPKALAMWGFIDLDLVESQKEPDGRFPTVRVPNPEDPAALKMGIDRLIEGDGDILLATDPDTDRVGVAVNHHGNIIVLNGNEIACICLEHLCTAMAKQERIPDNGAFIKTIVTTELFEAIANNYSIPCFNVLTGFKYIGQQITNWEKEENGKQFIFGGEESYGYLLGDYARDKDAVIACALIAEAALNMKLQDHTLIDFLHQIYKKYGVYRETLLSVKFEETKAGREKMQNAMSKLRTSPPKQILGSKIVMIEDYLKSTRTHIKTEKIESLTLPKSNVLGFYLTDGTKLIIRPSGTEPKIKLYCGVKSDKSSPVDLGIEHCDTIAKEYIKTMENHIFSL